MIKEIKLGLSLMKYGLNYQMTLVGVLISVAMTILIEWILPISIIGAMTLSLMPLLIVQLIYSVSVSTMVQTSPYKRRLQTTVPTIFALICGIIANTIVIIPQCLHHQQVVNNTNPMWSITYEPGEYETGFIFSAIFIVWLLLYTTWSMKNFWSATIIMIGGFWAVKTYAEQGELIYIVMPEWLAIVLSYVIILLGCVLFYIITCVTYKQPYSDVTFNSLLKRVS